MSKTVYVDSACNLLYSSFYLSALDELYPGKWRFNNSCFRSLDAASIVLHIIVVQDDQTMKLAIDHGNLPEINEQSYNWCDVYGKVNLQASDVSMEKIVAIGPLTAIRFKSFFWTITHAIFNLFRSYGRIQNVRLFLSLYKGQLRRPELTSLKQKQSIRNYIFFASTIWKKETWVNEVRANFIKVCRQISDLNFEGGFAPRIKKDIQGFEAIQMAERLSEKTYMEKIAASSIVFNTPSVAGCNGWRLCEYLMMGKTILSTPLVRVMPQGFDEGQVYIETDGSMQSIEEKVCMLLNDNANRTQLENRARKYYETSLAPSVVLKKLLCKSEEIKKASVK